MEGLEKMLPSFPFLGLPLARCAGTFGQQRLLLLVFFQSPAPVRGRGPEAAGLLTFPPLIHFFFGQQGGAGFFAFVDNQPADRGPFGCGDMLIFFKN